jgi:hypothetical protein
LGSGKVSRFNIGPGDFCVVSASVCVHLREFANLFSRYARAGERHGMKEWRPKKAAQIVLERDAVVHVQFTRERDLL